LSDQTSLWRRILTWAQAHATVKNVATLLTGTVVSQVATLILSIPLARLYSPAEYGGLALYQAVVALIATIAALRYDITVMLPKSWSEARVVKSLATLCIIIVSVVSTILACVLAGRVGSAFHSSTLTWWLPTVGLSIFLTAETTNLQYWLNRSDRYKAIAINRMVASVMTVLCQLALAMITRTASGLILGSILGLAIAYAAAIWQARDLLSKPAGEYPTMRQMARRYRKMPLMNGPNTLVDSLRVNGISFLIARVAMEALGQFNLAWRITQAPVGLLTSAIGQVYLREFSQTARGQLYPVTKRALTRLALVGFPVMAVFAVIAPWIVPFVFGSAWAEAGYISQALTPWLLVVVVTSPLSYIYVVTETQGRLLILAVVLCGSSLVWLWLTPLSLLPSIWVLSGIMTVLLLVMIIMAVLTVKKYDRSAPSADEVA